MSPPTSNTNLPTPQASIVLGLSEHTLRNWARGRVDRGRRIEPKFTEGVHYFRRSQAHNSPLIWRIRECREFLDSQGYVLPPLQDPSSEEGQD